MREELRLGRALNKWSLEQLLNKWPMTTFLLPITMREVWHLVKHTARLGTTKIQHKALTDTPVITTVAAQHLQALHSRWRCALGRVAIGLSAVLRISIPATASIVFPQRTNERTTEPKRLISRPKMRPSSRPIWSQDLSISVE